LSSGMKKLLAAAAPCSLWLRWVECSLFFFPYINVKCLMSDSTQFLDLTSSWVLALYL
jgi:hypothetical protein